jgi:hypothetical protein
MTLRKELPDLLAVLSVRLGAIDRVMYNRAEWAKAPRRLSDRWTSGSPRRIPSATSQHPRSAREGREKILLLVVPPHSDPDHAHETMMTAAAPDNASSVDDLLRISAPGRKAHGRAAATEQR